MVVYTYRNITIAQLEDLTEGVNPFNRADWHGRLVSLDGASTSDFTPEDVAEIVASGATDGAWEGEAAAILRLCDGRYVTYETTWGPTGNGFSADAYGGDADLRFSRTYETAVRMGLTDDGRDLCGIPHPT